MATVKEMMIDSLSKASKAAEQITSNVERAAAFTSLANACAAALKVKDDNAEVEVTAAPEEKTKKTSKKESMKQAAPKKKSAPEPEPEEEEVTFTEEWDAAAMEALSDEMAEFNRYCEMFSDDEETLNELISSATEGLANDKDDVTPLNIKMVVAYIQAQEAAAEEEEE